MKQIYGWVWKHVFEEKSAAWTALFTAVLAVVTVQLYRVANSAHETSRITQRAYVSFGGILPGRKITIATAGTQKVIAIQLIVPWENSGTTPTRNAVSQFNWQAWPSELPKGFDFPDLPSLAKRIFVIGPKGVASGPLVIPIADMDSVRKRQSRLFVWGWITYHDIFEGTRTRLTEFCTEVTNVTSSVEDITDQTTNISWQSIICPDHNCYDEDCSDYEKRTSKSS